MTDQIRGEALEPSGCIEPMLGCGGSCLDPSTDRNHCGECNNRCGSAETCTAGDCFCTTPCSEVWGAYIHRDYILASDMNSGLWVFRVK